MTQINGIVQVAPTIPDQIKEGVWNCYADQAVRSNHGYASGYAGKSRLIDEQIKELQKYQQIFLKFRGPIDWTLNDIQKGWLMKSKPKGSEGYFATVFHKSMVTHCSENPFIDQSGPVTGILEALSKQRNGRVKNGLNGALNSQYYHRSETSTEKMRILWESQGCPTGIILIPAQLGIEHRGESVLRARAIIRGSELPLDVYEGLQMVLTHENRLRYRYDLWIDLPGSEYSPNADDLFEYALCIKFYSESIGLDCRNTSGAFAGYGSASGFIPE